MSSFSEVVVSGRMAVVAAALCACGSGAERAEEGAAPDVTRAVPTVSQPPEAEAPSAVSPTDGSSAAPSDPVLEGNPSLPAPGPPVPEPTGSAEGEAPEAQPTPDPRVLPDGDSVGPEPDVATRAQCTGTDPIACHLGGQPGNYDVSVVLGGSSAANTIVRAEARRTLLPAVATAAGETRRLTFSVNVRQPEGEPIQAVPAGTPGLDLYFVGADGAMPAVEAIGFRPAVEPPVIYIAGDSTVADQTDVEFGGWGQQLPQYLKYPVVVANYADSGESSGSFLNSRSLFGAIEPQLTARDWVLIQFGHNDKQVSAADFHDNITRLVTRVKAKGASPVLVTPVARAQFDGDQAAAQHINGVGANLPEIVRQVATEQSVPVLDLTDRTRAWLADVGPRGWPAFHAHGTDVTHTNDAGALVEAGYIRDLVVEAQLEPLASQFR